MTMAGEDQAPKTDLDKDVRAYQVVGKSLLERIRAGEFRTAGKLPTERELAEIYGVGRAVVRDALVMLEVKGLVQSRQGSGIYITPRAYEVEASAAEDAPDALTNLPPAGPLEFLQAHQWFDSQISRLAASAASEEELADIQQACDNCRKARSFDDFEDLDMAFRLALARASHNAELVNLTYQLGRRRANNPLWRDAYAPLFRQGGADMEGRRRIVDAMRRRDPDAAFVATWQYIQDIKDELVMAAAKSSQRRSARRPLA